jgi:hypothetical protein
LAKNNSLFNYDNCADSAGFYWVCPEITATGENGLTISDAGFTVKNITHASRLVNGNVAPENINGLDVRLQLSVFLKYVLLDLIPDKDSELITFFGGETRLRSRHWTQRASRCWMHMAALRRNFIQLPIALMLY